VNRRLLAFLATAAILAFPWRAMAERPGPGGWRIWLDDEPAGPFLLRVVTSPIPPRIGSLYLEIRVKDRSSGGIVTDARVIAHASPADGSVPALEFEAMHDIAPVPTEYAVHLPVSEAGIWMIEVAVESRRGVGQAGFDQPVSASTSLPLFLGIGIPFGGLILLSVIFLWMQPRSRSLPGQCSHHSPV
jgi:hypothetical protein